MTEISQSLDQNVTVFAERFNAAQGCRGSVAKIKALNTLVTDINKKRGDLVNAAITPGQRNFLNITEKIYKNIPKVAVAGFGALLTGFVGYVVTFSTPALVLATAGGLAVSAVTLGIVSAPLFQYWAQKTEADLLERPESAALGAMVEKVHSKLEATVMNCNLKSIVKAPDAESLISTCPSLRNRFEIATGRDDLPAAEMISLVAQKIGLKG